MGKLEMVYRLKKNIQKNVIKNDKNIVKYIERIFTDNDKRKQLLRITQINGKFNEGFISDAVIDILNKPDYYSSLDKVEKALFYYTKKHKLQYFREQNRQKKIQQKIGEKLEIKFNNENKDFDKDKIVYNLFDRLFIEEVLMLLPEKYKNLVYYKVFQEYTYNELLLLDEFKNETQSNLAHKLKRALKKIEQNLF